MEAECRVGIGAKYECFAYVGDTAETGRPLQGGLPRRKAIRALAFVVMAE